MLAAYGHWGLTRITAWMAPHWPSNVTFVRLVLAADQTFAAAQARFLTSAEPFDRWLRAQLRLHGIGVDAGFAPYVIEDLGRQSEPGEDA